MWDKLAATKKYILLYGRGNAAQRIVSELRKRGKDPSGFFASDDFVRPKSFLGYPVTSFSVAIDRFDPDNSIVLLAFGTHREEVLQNILRIAERTEFYAPDLPVAGETLFDRAYLEAHRKDFAVLRERLADEQSRLVLDCVLTYKQTWRIEPLLSCNTPQEESWALLTPSPGKNYIDLGAYTGDTVLAYLKALDTPCDPSILAVEPEPRNFRKLQETVAAAGLPNVRCVQAVIGDRTGMAEISKGAGRGSQSQKKVPVSAETLDHLLAGSPAHILKMDVEGSESAALRGAAETIKKYRPAMRIAAYHRTEDLLEIPKQVLALQPDYHVFLRRGRCLPAWEIDYLFV